VAAGLACQGGVPAPAPSTGETISFSNQVQPIFNAHCTACHAEATVSSALGSPLRLTANTSYQMLVNQRSAQSPSWTLVVPGDTNASLLWRKVSSTNPPVGARMPLIGAPLSSRELGLLRDWIAQGAPDN
jgi:hypothetical protein